MATANGPSALHSLDITPEKQAGILHFISAQLSFKPVPVTDVDLTGKTAIVTGSNCGIGLEISRQLLKLGIDKLILAVRNEQKGNAAATDLAAGRNPPLKDGTIEVWKLDLDSYDSVVSFGSRAKSLKRLDLVFLNAGIVLAKRAFNEQTKHDEIIQVNYLSTALLALSLLPAIKAARSNQLASTRMTFTLSEGAAWSKFKFNTNESILKSLDAPSKDYDTTSHMMTSKLLGQFFVAELAKRIPSSLAIINSASPGAIHDSQFNREIDQTFAGAIFKRFQKYVANTSAVGAHMMTYAALKHGEETHGQFLSFQKMVPMAPILYGEEGRKIGQRLWQETMEELAFANPEELLRVALS
ncbi:short-chain dehydrogenase/reductase sdr [Fusarium flagelliforme]|uniref:Short-chain dehydrogenase/reductase sdr n=1 Tax=Fusarium flagelliforme TaxID=2675880 RepID=A0A395MCD2_9HYPO|nr:short-chain dehydrogenase/reductase sdr [Fusarium flagelliforme]